MALQPGSDAESLPNIFKQTDKLDTIKSICSGKPTGNINQDIYNKINVFNEETKRRRLDITKGVLQDVQKGNPENNNPIDPAKTVNDTAKIFLLNETIIDSELKKYLEEANDAITKYKNKNPNEPLTPLKRSIIQIKEKYDPKKQEWITKIKEKAESVPVKNKAKTKISENIKDSK